MITIPTCHCTSAAIDGLAGACIAVFAVAAASSISASLVLFSAVSDEEEVVDKKTEIENSCKPQCIKPLLAVGLDMGAVVSAAQSLQGTPFGHWAAVIGWDTLSCGLAA